jgi:hypothetical protein
MQDQSRLQELTDLIGKASPDNLLGVFESSTNYLYQIEDPFSRQLAEFPLSNLRSSVFLAEPGLKLSSSPPEPTKELEDIEVLQLFGIERALQELSFAFEMVEFSSAMLGSGSAQSRFYLNSIYHYLSSMFLIDTSKKTHRNLPMGGTIIRALHPLGLSYLLDRILNLTKEPISGNRTFGDTILLLKHSYLVHGTFSPGNVELLVIVTEMRDPDQRELFFGKMWWIFHEIILLRLKILAIFPPQEINVMAVLLS